MKNIIIISASGFGREVYWLLRSMHSYGVEFTIKGFLEDRKDILNQYSYPVSIISSVEAYQPVEGDFFVCVISNPLDKLKYTSMIKQKGGIFFNVIAPTSLISGNLTCGEGVIISYNCSISCDVQIGNFVTINAFASLGHDCRLEDYAHVNSFSSINGHAQIGAFATVHSHAVVLPSIHVGKYAIVGAGSVLLKNVPDHQTVFGVPATRVMT